VLPLAGPPSIALPEHVVSALKDVAARPAYPGTIGMRELRVAIAKRLSEEIGRTVNPDSEVLITVGSMQALHLAGCSTSSSPRWTTSPAWMAEAICRGRQPTLAPAPSFFGKDIVAAAGGECFWVGGEDGAPDWTSMCEKATSTQPSAVFACNPVNPTGYVFSDADLDGLARTVAGTDAWVVSDEAYNGYLHDGRIHHSPSKHPDLADRTIVIRSFSKTYALGSWRVGFAAGPEHVISAMAKLLQYSILGVPTVAQVAALSALTGPQEWICDLGRQVSEWRFPVLEAVLMTRVLSAELPQAGTTV
jgi:aspartate/methionine/tyrosine aminotransferase